MLRVHLAPTGLYSRAMVRVADALTRYAPPHVSIVIRPDDADLRILHVIGYDAIDAARTMVAKGQRYVAIQYCLRSTAYSNPFDWADFWRGSSLVWSYYDLSDYARSLGFSFYHSPLGLDPAFTASFSGSMRRRLVLTSGYVSSPQGEAIEEVWLAAARAGVEAIHLGPKQVEGMATTPPGWRTTHEISDEDLANLYRSCTWVSALRHTEGFEMPGIEGLACGARPLVFDQPSQRHWYGPHAIYLSDRHGPDLVSSLATIFSYDPRSVNEQERVQVLDTFDWRRIATEFWSRIAS